MFWVALSSVGERRFTIYLRVDFNTKKCGVNLSRQHLILITAALMTTCSSCSSTSKPLKICSGCQSANYCSVDCQKSHWKEHKQACKSMKAALTQVTLAKPGKGGQVDPLPTSDGQIDSLASITNALSSAFPATIPVMDTDDVDSESDDDEQIESIEEIRRKMGGEGFVKFGTAIDKLR